MRESQKVEGLRFTPDAFALVWDSEPSKPQQPRLFGVQFQCELRESLAQVVPKLFGVLPVLERASCRHPEAPRCRFREDRYRRSPFRDRLPSSRGLERDLLRDASYYAL